jgi:SNF2 family DNA or RNA helicase
VKLLATAFPRGSRSAAFRDLLRVPLYEYQREAALFAARAGRCLVADDMGLGKTMEAIAGVEIMARHFGVERVLVVCPTSLKHQWEREIARATRRPALVVGGLRSARAAAFRARGFYKVTNYDTVHADLDLIAAWSPDLVILDEAQRIKNWSTRTARSVKRIASPYAIVLTGTPLENRLEELLEAPDVKAVVFSQWVRMHQVLLRRLERRRWGHVLFHGGVDTARRTTLVDRFREDPRCRLFLSTDAGGVGLNLQHASVVVNADLPWNPAVLEQRIARVHRLGQSRPVQVLSFVARGTIEDGMQSVLDFKRSVFAGVLDGGASEVFLGGSRLKRFIDSVERVTQAIPAAAAEETPADGAGDAAGVEDATGRHVAGGTAMADPWAGLLQTGLELLGQLSAAPAGPARTGNGGTTSPVFERLRDEKTGQSYLKVRMPERDVVDRVTGALQLLLESLQR